MVTDFTLGSIRTPIEPTMYFVDRNAAQYVYAELCGRRLPETLRSIGGLWRRTGRTHPIDHMFEDQSIQSLYRDVVVQEVVIAACAGLAILIACLDLRPGRLHRRAADQGDRGAQSHGRLDVGRGALLLWQFTRPVLWANLIAWPLAFWAMDRLLQGFAYRVALPPWLLLSASGDRRADRLGHGGRPGLAGGPGEAGHGAQIRVRAGP